MANHHEGIISGITGCHQLAKLKSLEARKTVFGGTTKYFYRGNFLTKGKATVYYNALNEIHAALETNMSK